MEIRSCPKDWKRSINPHYPHYHHYHYHHCHYHYPHYHITIQQFRPFWALPTYIFIQRKRNAKHRINISFQSASYRTTIHAIVELNFSQLLFYIINIFLK